MELKGKKIIKKVVKSLVIGVISSILLFIFSLTFIYLLDSTADSNIPFTMNHMISMSLFTLICLQFVAIMTGFIVVVVYSDKKIWPEFPALIPLIVLLLFTIAFKIQFFSYSNDGISDVKKIYKIATCKHDFCDVGCFLLDNNGNYYDMDYVVKYLNNHSKSNLKYENDLERPGMGYRKCTKCGYIINHYTIGRVKGTKYILEYDSLKHKDSRLVFDGPESHLHGYKGKDKNIKKSMHTWTGWKTIKTHELGNIQVRSCSVCGMEDYQK